MLGYDAEEEGAPSPSRPMLHTFANVSQHHDIEDHSFSHIMDGPDTQRLLGEDSLDEEFSRRRPLTWRNLSSSVLSRRPLGIRQLAGRRYEICHACEKLMPRRRKAWRTLVLVGLGTTLTLYALDTCLLAVSKS
jgi:hypothetical protein